MRTTVFSDNLLFDSPQLSQERFKEIILRQVPYQLQRKSQSGEYELFDIPFEKPTIEMDKLILKVKRDACQ